MLSSVLSSPRAIAVNVLIMRAFVQLRRAQGQYTELRQRIDELARRVEGHDELLSQILAALNALAEPERTVHALVGHPVLRPVVFAAIAGVLAFSMYLALIVLFHARALGLDAATIGTVFAIGGVGALAGAISAPRVVARVGLGPSMVLGFALGTAGMVVTALASGPPLVAATLAAVGQFVLLFVFAFFNVVVPTLRQTVTPHRLLGARQRDVPLPRVGNGPARLAARRRTRRDVRTARAAPGGGGDRRPRLCRLRGIPGRTDARGADAGRSLISQAPPILRPSGRHLRLAVSRRGSAPP